MDTTDITVNLGDGERIELSAVPGLSILLRTESGGEEIDVALYPGEAESLVAALQRAIEVAKTGTEI